MRRAVIDVGSNSVLLLVAENLEGAWHTVFESSEVTGLGEGTRSSGALSEGAMTRTLAAVSSAWVKANSVGAQSIVAAATMATRIATNTADFQERAERQGTPIQVLSGEEEARLGLAAVVDDPAFAAHSRLSIVDVGGHSTEIATLDRMAGERFRKSFPVGTLALRDGLLSDETPALAAVLRASAELDEMFGFACLPGEAGQCVALGATGTNLVTIRERMLTWDPDKVHGTLLDYEEISRASGWLMRMTDGQRAAVPGMERGRERTMHLGALILERALFALRSEGCAVSVRGWRHALLPEIAQMV